MRISIPHGDGELEFEIDEKRVVGIMSPLDMAPSSDPDLEVEKALKNPIEGPTIEMLSPKGKTVAIAVDDVTRVTPSQRLLSPLLKLLENAGAKSENIRIIVALGTHREMTDREMKEKYGADTVENYEVINHAFREESELEYLGTASGNLPVWINKHFLRADIRIATGNLVPHFSAGWGAGAKILLPGLAGEETVGQMHVRSAMTTANGLGIGENPTRQLIDAFAEKVGIHLLVNTVITRHREIVKVFAGHYARAHRKGIDFAKRIYGVRTPALADITISSSHPADIEYWQATKALFSADLATKPGGGIVELTPCPEGVALTHPKWIEYLQHDTEELKKMCEVGEIEDLVGFGMALHVAQLRERHPVCVVSEGISDRDAARMGFRKFGTIEEAVQYFSRSYGLSSKINVLTKGGETYPILE